MTTPSQPNNELDKAIERASYHLDHNVDNWNQSCDDLTLLIDTANHVKDLLDDNQRLGVMADHLLAHCKVDECEECSKIVCRFKEPLHFHHDGCPSCVTYEQMQEQLSTLRADYKLALEKNEILRQLTERTERVKFCPHCGTDTIQPNGSGTYCEECGWPNEERK